MNNSKNNLSTFRILFLIKGILTLFVALVFIFYAAIGVFVGGIVESKHGVEDLPFNPGDIVLTVGVIGFFFFATLGILTIISSNYMEKLRNYNFVFVVAILNALTGILGILLAIFSLIELTKPHVKKLFYKSN